MLTFLIVSHRRKKSELNLFNTWYQNAYSIATCLKNLCFNACISLTNNAHIHYKNKTKLIDAYNFNEQVNHVSEIKDG